MGGFQSSLSSALGTETYEVCQQKCSAKEEKRIAKEKKNDYVVVERNQPRPRTQPQPQTTPLYNPSKQKLPQARPFTKPYSSAEFGSLGGGGRKKKINRKSSKKRKLKKNKKKSLKRKK